MTIRRLIETVHTLSEDDLARFAERTLGALTVRQALDLVRHLEQEWDVEAAPRVAIVGPAPTPEPKPVRHDVVLLEGGQARIAIMRKLKDLLGCKLTEARDLVHAAPVPLLESTDLERAEALQRELIAAGALVELRQAAG